MKRIGILGGGQLSLMLAESLHALGARVAVYDPDPAAPARERLPHVTTRPWTDGSALSAFAAGCDVVTYELEHVPVRTVDTCAARTAVWPGMDVLRTTQDRAAEKRFLADNGVPHVPYRAVDSPHEVERAAVELGYPCVLKSARGGYDGKGQTLVTSPAALRHALAHLADERGGDAPEWVLEAFITLEAEISCIVARDPDGHAVAFPVFENMHRDHILDTTLLPARVPAAVAAQARALALDVAARLGVIGLLTVEFFLGTLEGPAGHPGEPPRLYVNELAPRPHNSGHVTRNACTLNQFDALARVLVGAPLVEPRVLGSQTFCMGNLLGDVWGTTGAGTLDLRSWRDHPAVIDVFLYGKRVLHPRRKMGHFVSVGADAAEALGAAHAFRTALAHGRATARGTVKPAA